jgi:hypothetical protein
MHQVVIPSDRRGFGRTMRKHAWWSQSLLIYIAAGGLALGDVACGGGPSAPSGTSTSATLDSVVTTFRGALVESTPITIPSPEALDVEIRLTLDVPADSKATVYLCVMESASAIGVGTCLGVSDTAKGILAHAEPLRLAISTLKTDGVARTTNFVYVGLVEGAFPWPPSGSTPPRTGDRFGSNRVLATTQIARTITFR